MQLCSVCGLVSGPPGEITYLGTTVVPILEAEKEEKLEDCFLKIIENILGDKSYLYRNVLFISTGIKLAQLLKFIFLLIC